MEASCAFRRVGASGATSLRHFVPLSAAARFLPLASQTRIGKERLPGVLAVAGTSVLAFRKPDTIGDHSFQDIRYGLLERKENPSSGWNAAGDVRLAG